MRRGLHGALSRASISFLGRWPACHFVSVYCMGAWGVENGLFVSSLDCAFVAALERLGCGVETVCVCCLGGGWFVVVDTGGFS